MSLRNLTVGLAAVGLIASLPAGASAAKLSHRVDPDRDGLSTKTEKRIGTKARKADTDGDRLNDGREVRLGSNPLKADTDGNGTKDGAQLRGGDHPCGPATVGTVASVDTEAATVTVTLADGSSKTVKVNNSTVLRGVTDKNTDNVVTIADLAAGDQVIVRTSADDPELATMIAIRGAGRGHHGDEIEGTVASISSGSITVTPADGSGEKTFSINTSTEIKAFDRNNDGSVNAADISEGDKVEVEATSADPTVAEEIKLEGTKVWGTITALGTSSVTVTTATGASVTASVTSSTKFRVPDTSGDGTPGIADLKTGQQIDMVIVENGSDNVALVIGGGRGDHGDRGPRHQEDDPQDAPEQGDVQQQGDRQQRGGQQGTQGQQGPRGPQGGRGPRGR